MMLLFLVLLPFLGGLLAFLLPQNSQRKALLMGVSLIHLAFVVTLWGSPAHIGFTQFLSLDVLGKLILSIISVLFATISVYLGGYLKNEGPSNRVFTGCLLLLLAGMTLVSVSVHMGLLWVALEATTLLSAPLINFERSAQSTEAVWKYILICSVGIALALLGTIMLAISAGSLKTVFLNDLLNHAAVLTPSWLKLSIIFLLVGYGTKMGLAPMHTWKPDAYAQAPAPIGGLMSGALTACPILAILRLVQICNRANLSAFIESILIVMGILSLSVAAIFMLRQRDLGRMLAYSSVENMGIIALGIGLGQAAYWPSLFHLINNALTKGLMFMVAGNLYQYYHSHKIEQIQGVYTRWPIMGIFLIIGFMSLAGLPPLGIFYSEIMILNAAIQSRHYLTAVIFVVFLSIIFIGMAQSVFHMFHACHCERPKGAKILMPDTRSCSQSLKFEEIASSLKSAPRNDISSIMPILILGVVVLGLGLHIPQSLENVLQATKVLLEG